MDQRLRYDCNGGALDPSLIATSTSQQKESLAATFEYKKSKLIHKVIPPPNTVSSAMIHISGSPTFGKLNYGDSYLSVMLSVVETKLALAQNEGIFHLVHLFLNLK